MRSIMKEHVRSINQQQHNSGSSGGSSEWSHDGSIPESSSTGDSRSGIGPQAGDYGSVKITDFKILKPVSRGAYGRVYLAKKRDTGHYYAIKVMRKKDLIRKNMQERVNTERNILAYTKNKFVVRCFYTFTNHRNLYIVMEYLNGGDCSSLLRNLGCLDEHAARVYIAETAMALEYCHAQGINHRDLKPDNLLISSDGHIKLTDFGLSCVGIVDRSMTTETNSRDPSWDEGYASTSTASNNSVSRTDLSEGEASTQHNVPITWQPTERHKAVGTPDYMAPELLLGREHGSEVDWWSLGAILYELVTGTPPFSATTQEGIFDNILDRRITWPCEGQISPECRDLIDRLLTLEPTERLGHKGAWEVKQHPFFNGVDWDALQNRQSNAAFVPSVDGETDTSYFSSKPVSLYSMELDGPGILSSSGASYFHQYDNSSGSQFPPSPMRSNLDSSRYDGRDFPASTDCDSSPDGSHLQHDFTGFSFTNYDMLVQANREKINKIRAEFGESMEEATPQSSDDESNNTRKTV